MKRQSLLIKIWLMFAGVVVMLGCVASISIWKLSQNAVSQQMKSDVKQASSYVKKYFEQSRYDLGMQAALITEQPGLRAILADPKIDTATLSDFLGGYQKSAKADGLIYFNANGKARFSLGAAPKVKSLRSADKEAFLNQDLARLDGFESISDGLLLSVCLPVKIGQQVLGFVGVYKKVDNYVASEMAQPIDIQIAFLFHGQVAASSLPSFHETTPNREIAVKSYDSMKYGTVSFPITEQASKETIDVTILRPQAKVTEPYDQLNRVFMISLSLSLVVAIALSGFFAKGLIANLQTVVKAAKELSEGAWPEKLVVKTKDEVGLLQDVFNKTVDSLKKAQDKLMAMIDLDPLTDLHNHRNFKEVLNSEVARSNVTSDDLALLLLDIDKFKEFNEANGHGAGDQALITVASTIRANTPEFAHIARFGGNEFTVLLPDSDLNSAEMIAELIRREVHLALPDLSMSVGCAQFGVSTSRSEGLMIAAELALARAKQLGRDRVCRFDSVPGAEGDADPYQLYKYMQDASLATIQALAAAVDAKDAYTQGHSMRVAEYARDLATFIGLSEPIRELTFRTGTLHDVGKIGVPDSILNKPGRLDDDERAIMETHAVLGELIVKKAPQLQDTIPGVRHHHESYDGRGYPDGLKGEEIPLIARLLTIADTYDAMTSDRPYRKGLAIEIALGEIRKGAGTQFDPEFAASFIAMMESRSQQLAA